VPGRRPGIACAPAPAAQPGLVHERWCAADSHGTEDDLVRAAQAGGTWAFARLWELLAPKVSAYVRHRGVASPDDVTSDVFLAAFARIGDFDGDGDAFRRFLFTLAHHKSVDDIRKRFGPRVPRQIESPHEQDLPRSPSAEDVVLHGELSPQIGALVAALPALQREVLLLRVVAGLDISDVAVIVGRSEGAVKQLQHRALRFLRSQIEENQLAPGVTQDPRSPIARTP
jgi:RNA polymerase sigma factor (sigma-70 family)